VDEIELVVTVFVGKGCDDAAISVTDDRRVVLTAPISSKFGGSFVPVSVHRQIQRRRLFGGVFADRCGQRGLGRAVVVELAVALCPVRNDGVSVAASGIWSTV